jgi:signal peptidase
VPRRAAAMLGELGKQPKRQLLLQFVNLGEPPAARRASARRRRRCRRSHQTRCTTTLPAAAGMIITSALMLWKGLILATGSESPIVVVLSGSMEPGFHRGDILLLHQRPAPPAPGDVVVFSTNGREIPIVHRVVKALALRPAGADSDGADGGTSGAASTGVADAELLTKGDNNWGDDRSLYPAGQLWLRREHVIGRVVGFVPHIGRATIVMNDFPAVKYALIGLLGLFVVTSKE